jgi:4-amino-4-deoxy-L-arabinose transferase-like glycosyltransferase
MRDDREDEDGFEHQAAARSRRLEIAQQPRHMAAFRGVRGDDGVAMTAGLEAGGDASRPWLALGRASERSSLSIGLLLVLSILAFLPGFASMPPMDRDEPRFAQASKQMLETGDLVNIRFQTEARLKKPVGIYWLQAAAVSAGDALGVPQARTTIALYRIPSLLAAIGAVLLTWWTGLALVGNRGALLGGVMMAGSLLLGVEARLAKTDATLLLTIVAMMGALAHLRFGIAAEKDEGGGLRLPAIFWTAMAGSILVKGPIGPLVVGLTLLSFIALTREWRWLSRLRWLPGLAWALLLVSPWFIAIMIETGGGFLQKSVGDDMMAKVAGGQESHGAPPGTYFAAFWLTLWPFAPLAAVAAPFVWRNRARPQIAFLLAWLVPSWLLFEIIPTKLPHYVLPLYPAAALLIAAAATADGLARGRWTRIVLLLVPLVAVAVGAAGLGAIWHYQHDVAWLFTPFALVGIAAGIFAWRRYGAGAPMAGIGLSLLSALSLYWGVYAAGMPALPALWPSPRLAAFARGMDCADPAFATAGFREPSLVFLVDTRLAMPADGGGAAEFLAAGACRMAFVEHRQEEEFIARAREKGLTPRLVGRVAGINTNGGKALDIGVYRSP